MRRLVTIHHPYILPEKTARVATFYGHLILLLPTKPEKSYTTMMTWHCTTPQRKSCPLIALIAAAAPFQRGLLRQSLAANFSGHDDNFEPMVEIFLVRIKG
jgi:hypothetical protein